MGRKWVLDTETKGTGAQMVPLEKVQRGGDREAFPYVPPARGRHSEPEPEPQAPRRFRVVDVMTREVLAEDADTRTTLDVLERVDSVVDVRVSAWEPATGRWRLLTLGEQRMLWDYSKNVR